MRHSPAGEAGATKKHRPGMGSLPRAAVGEIIPSSRVKIVNSQANLPIFIPRRTAEYYVSRKRAEWCGTNLLSLIQEHPANVEAARDAREWDNLGERTRSTDRAFSGLFDRRKTADETASHRSGGVIRQQLGNGSRCFVHQIAQPAPIATITYKSRTDIGEAVENARMLDQGFNPARFKEIERSAKVPVSWDPTRNRVTGMRKWTFRTEKQCLAAGACTVNPIPQK